MLFQGRWNMGLRLQRLPFKVHRTMEWSKYGHNHLFLQDLIFLLYVDCIIHEALRIISFRHSDTSSFRRSTVVCDVKGRDNLFFVGKFGISCLFSNGFESAGLRLFNQFRDYPVYWCQIEFTRLKT